MLAPLVDRIVAAADRLSPFVRVTPLESSPAVTRATGAPVHLKCENLQRTGSFKLRGALNKVLLLGSAAREPGVVAASTGNHGRGVAEALAAVGGRGTICLPVSAPREKVASLEAYASVRLEIHGADSAEAEAHARRLAAETGRVYISPYNDLDVIAGQGTVGVEIRRQCPDVDAVFVSVGGGGLIAGVAGYLKAQNPGIRIVGCWPEHAPALCTALRRGRIVQVAEKPTLSDATAGGLEPGAVTFDLVRDLIDDCVLVSEEAIAGAIRLVLAEHRLVIEGAAGVAVAGCLEAASRDIGRSSVAILCGANIASSTLASLVAPAARDS